MDLVWVGACALGLLQREVSAVEGGWREQLTVRVEAEGGPCRAVDLVLPDGVAMERVKGRVRLGDGSGRRLVGPRLERRIRDLAGWGALRMHSPEMVDGDRLEARLTRRWSADRWSWDGSGFVPQARPAPPALPELLADAELTHELRIPGEAQRTLYPGGGSQLATTWWVRFHPSQSAQGLVIPVPPDASGFTVEGAHTIRDDSVLLLAPAGEGADALVSWTQPDAPDHGERVQLPGALLTHQVLVDAGRIRWEGDAWWLHSVGMRQVVPSRPDLLRALDARFQRASLPEPALPASLRGHPADLELVAALRPILHDRAGVAALPLPPLFPRRLVRARRSGALNSVEAALILRAQLGHAGIPATWAIARPASAGPGPRISPAGYTHGLVVFELDGQRGWIDPACAVCAPFELPPDLQGADVLSLAEDRTPLPTEGALHVRDHEADRQVELHGPAALALRLEVDALPAAARDPLLAERFGGEGARLLALAGLAEPGAPIRLTVTLGEVPPDPLAPPPAAWWGWVGERTWTRPHPDLGAAPAHAHEGPLCWTARQADGLRTERLVVAERAVPEAAAQAIGAARTADAPAR